MALGAGAKFATIALAPLMAAGTAADACATARCSRWCWCWCSPLVFVPFLPDGGIREVYDRTVGYQASRPSPFSVWGQVDSLGWLQTAVKAGRVLALAVAFVPRRRDAFQVAALGAAVLSRCS